MGKKRRFGPVVVEAGRRTDDGVVFDVVVNGEDCQVEVAATPDAVVARWVDAPGEAGASSTAGMRVTFRRVDSDAHGPFTLPRQRAGEWVEAPVDEATLRYTAGGPVGEWISGAGGELATACQAHAPDCCVSFPVERLGVAVVAVAATRIRPVLQGVDFADPLPWEPASTPGRRTGHVHASAIGGDGTLVGELELYDKLVDAVEAAVSETGACVEFGIVEHVFAFANVDDYRFLYDRFGHISVDHAQDYTLSGYLGQLLGHLSRDDQVVHVQGRGTGYWDYNSDISHWGLPGADKSATVSWRDYAVSKGRHPMSWPAASLLWGEEPVLEQSWSGHLGPGESPPGVTAETLPGSVSDPRLVDFAKSFDTTAAFGADATPIARRIRRNWEDSKGLPRDMGLLRAALGQADLDDHAYGEALLRHIGQLV